MTNRYINIDAWHHWYWRDDPLPAEPHGQGKMAWPDVEEAIRGSDVARNLTIQGIRNGYYERQTPRNQAAAERPIDAIIRWLKNACDAGIGKGPGNK